jgi:hypothetical protein
VGDDTSRSAEGKLTEDHAVYLASQAVDVKLAESLGVRSLLTAEDVAALGDPAWTNFANLPAIAFPWTNEDGEVMWQARPDNPTVDQKTGKPRKYVFARQAVPKLWAVRPVADAQQILLIEGTKQCLAGASYAPPGVGVYGFAGARLWQHNGHPIPDLIVADGREVIVILDADAATNPQVYDAGTNLAAALGMEGATKVLFTRLMGAEKSGLDDILAGRQPERRASMLARLIKNAKPKPADVKPKPAKKAGKAPAGEEGRVTIIVNRDRLAVINDLTQALLDKWNASALFCHGGVISRREGDRMTPVDRGSFHDLVQATAMTVNENEGANGTTYSFAWPDSGTMAATMSRANQFAALDRITHAPFIRPDGTVASEPGYDEDTRTLLLPDEVFAGLEVPEDPTPEQVAAARELIMTEWLGDFPLDAEADRANLLGLIVTPAIRGMVPRVPLAVVDGLQMGVGKNLLADSILTVYTGHAAQPMNWVSEPEELRKQITAAFRTGAEFFLFDEAHTVEGAPLAQALTAETWQDRILGVSTMANFPNRVTWISLGNNVQVKGDITRRVYRIALRPEYANPQDRPSSSFRHPGTSGLDLGSWTRKHRRELLTAVLTLVRAWFSAGSPYPKRGVSFGSFEAWERIVGGIVEHAGMTSFLGNLKVWRSESDFDTQYWLGHLAWLREQFGDEGFRTSDVKNKANTIGVDLYSAPPRLDDPTERTYGKALGEAYSRIAGRRYGALWVERAGHAHGHVSLWKVHESESLPPFPPGEGPSGPDTGPDTPPDNVPDSDLDIPLLDPAPENEHAEARGAAPEDTDGEGHDEVRGAVDTSVSISGPAAILHGEAPGLLAEMGRALAAQGLDTNGEPQHAGADGSCPDYGSALDPCPPGCASGTCVANLRPQPVDKVGDTVTFDLETGDAGDQYKHPGPGYTRIGATAMGDGPVKAYDLAVVTQVADDIRQGSTITGHNVMAFDLPVLVREGVMTMEEVHQLAADGRVFDALLAARYLDPPMARDKGVDATRKYDLGALGEKYGLGAKQTDVSKPLAKKYGGWGEIPIDVSDPDPDRAADAQAFQGYMVQDVELSRSLYSRLMEEFGGTVPEYLRREHRVAAIASQISVNGFLVDQELLSQRVTEIERRKASAMEMLAAKYGVPTHDPKGKPYKSPLATKGGKEAIGAALVAAGIPAKALWRTETSKDLQLSADAMLHYGRDYHHLPAVVEVAKAVYRIVSARSIYETTRNSMGPDGRIHPKVSFRQATGRWSLTEPGLTVFGKRGGRHVERDVLLADPGEVLVAFDLSQVDMRAIAGLSQDQAYIQMLLTEDPHAELAELLLGDRSKRETAKPIGHGWNYGRGVKAICQANNLDPAVGWKFDQSMRERFPRVVDWQTEVRALAASGQLLDNGFGRLMRPDPQRAHTQGPALMGQGAARDLMMEGMLRLPAECLPMLRAQVHDEIVLSIPVKQVEEVSRAVIEALSFEWRGVPILADRSRAGASWGRCYTKD